MSLFTSFAIISQSGASSSLGNTKTKYQTKLGKNEDEGTKRRRGIPAADSSAFVLTGSLKPEQPKTT